MKNILLFALALVFMQACSSRESILVLSPSQSMSVTGKGAGQDAAYNPYSEGNSLAIVRNIGKKRFQVRIEKENEVIVIVTVQPSESRELNLLEGYELYLDSEFESKARVDFKKAEKPSHSIETGQKP